MQKLPIGIQTFEKIRDNNFLYVDKTMYYKPLIEQGQFVFMARPRRFGKSLLLSTLRCIFQGKKELFEGLWIENEIDWKVYPVIYIDFNSMNYKDNALQTELSKVLDRNALDNNVELSSTNDPKQKFIELLEKLTTDETKPVILIDEYDKPIVDYIGEEKIKDHISTLKTFYGTLKAKDSNIHYCLLTGVSKFGKVSIFSDLNNLQDVSMSPTFACMLGITQTELDSTFSSYLSKIATDNAIDTEILRGQIKKWYNGYSWDGENTLYCPFSLLNYFSPFNSKGTFRNFWFETGTPTFLTNLLKEDGILPTELEWQRANFAVIQSPDTNNVDIISMLFQTGYLTIKEIKSEFGEDRFYLSYPNHEVRHAFSTYLLAEYMAKQPSRLSSLVVDKLQTAIVNHDWESLVNTLNSVLASIAYQIFRAEEAWFHSMVHIAFTLTGMQTISEYGTNKGRIDDVLMNGDEVFIFEYKMDKNAQIAFDQIKHKEYALPFNLSEKKVWGVGLNFNSKDKKIDNWVVERI